MKYVNNGISQNVIQDSDINLSESFQNQNLAEVLTQYREDLNTLKSNVKWLAKYGGVGGSGGGGGGSNTNIKLKYKVDVSYTNNSGIQSSESFASKTSSNRILAQYGTKASLTITLQKCMPGVDYKVKITCGEQKYDRTVNSLTLSVSQDILCVGNLPVSIIVYNMPDDMPETVIQVYTIAQETDFELRVSNGVIVPDGSIVLDSYVQNDETKLIGTMTNYLQNLYQGQFKKLVINGQEIVFEGDVGSGNIGDNSVSCEIVTSLGASGEEVKQFAIPLKQLFKTFGVYEVHMTYEYNGIETSIKKVYIYKSEDVFLYCFGETNTVYTEPVASPSTSNYSVETVKFRIYPEEGKASNETYYVDYVISYQGKGPEYNVTGYVAKESNRDWDLKFQNKYSKTDFSYEGEYKQITLTFTINSIVRTYYMYITQMADISYIFTTQEGDLFYNAEHSCTATLTDDLDPNTTFPFQEGLFKKLTKDEEHLITKIAKKTSLTSAASVYGIRENNKLTGGYVTNYSPQDSAVDADVLISFGLKFDEFNLDLPIVTIKVNGTNSIILYSNRIKYGVAGEYTRWTIPRDGQYHLVQLYYKPRYSVDGNNYREQEPSNSSAFIWCIDGVLETQPIYINQGSSLVTFTANTSSITYHPGNWDMDFIGLATFNAKPTTAVWGQNKDNFKDEVLRYALDFDPIIPANYYQAYYLFRNKEPLKQSFDQAIYPSLYSSIDVDNVYGVNFYKNVNKFIPADPVTLGSLTNLPIYIIEPDPGNILLDGVPMNNFLHKTFAGGYDESSDPPVVSCTLKKGSISAGELVTQYLVSDTSYKFNITYQGSSTLKYGVKNFEIGADVYVDDEQNTHDVVWTPDINTFLPEKSFTLKADVVDSSHSNNVIVGKFVNNYMKDAAFSDKCKTCLEGFPILLFMQDTVTDSTNKYSDNTIFLGIYSFNLGRKSMYNLGYKELNTENCTDISAPGGISKAYVLNADASNYPRKYRVAEVQGNSPVLYDYSQYDQLMLSSKMLGDFFNYDGSSENTSFSTDFQRPFKGLNKLIYHKCIQSLVNNYDSFSFKSDNSELVGYYAPKKGNNIGLFNVLQLNFNYTGKKAHKDEYYYLDNNGRPKQVPSNGLILDNDQIGHIKPYLTLGANELSIIGNPMYQFHLICTSTGDASASGYYYIEELGSPANFDTSSDDYFEYDTLLRYYIVCMLFAMVDSVQKNLTIRCKDFQSNNSNAWYVGFYDMDTSFGVDNVGNPVDFKAFSDYILDSGKVVSDYFAENAENSEGAGFDVPSSFLFLAAKYLNILTANEDTTALGNRNYLNQSNTTLLRTPFNYWQTLRDEGGALETVDKFFATYVDNHFSSVNPLIWNLNYMYKYFSASGTKAGDTDTEQSKFNGTRRFSRKTWLQQRLEVIDVLFGIRNNHPIGNSVTQYICKQDASSNTITQREFSGFLKSVPIAQSMFPAFAKGVIGTDLNIQATSYPKAPIVLQLASGDFRLYLADSKGEFPEIQGSVPTNTDIGFFGTTSLKSLNECGQFLWNGSDLNTINNNLIQEIIINKGPANGNQKLQLNLSDMSSVSSIKINELGTENSIFKCNQLIIQADLQDFVLDTLIVKYTNCAGTITVAGVNGNKLTIKNLIITNCTASEIKFDNVEVENITMSSCTSESYTFIGSFPNISISDGFTKSFTLKASGRTMTATINLPALETLVVQGTISSFTNNATSQKCTSIDISNINAETVTLSVGGFKGYTSEFNIGFSDAVKHLQFRGNSCATTKYNFIGKNIQDVTYLSTAFYECNKLTAIQLNGATLINNKPVYVTGTNTFGYCGSLPASQTIPTKTGSLYLQDSSHTSMYYSNAKINITDVINFFKYVNTRVTSLDFTSMFAYTGIQFTTTSSSGVYSKPSNYANLVTAITNFLKTRTVNFSGIFGYTYFNFLDSTLINLFKSGTSIINVCANVRVENDNSIYVVDDFLKKNTSITNLTLGSYWFNSANSEGATYVKLLKERSDGRYELNTAIDIYDVLNNGKLSTINNFPIYTNNNIHVDCEKGLPETVTTVKYLTSNPTFYFKKIENLFNKVPSTCDVYFDQFFASTSDKVSAYLPEDETSSDVNVFQLFWKDNGTPKVRLKLGSKSVLNSNNNSTAFTRGTSGLNIPLNFNKTCTQGQFKKIMQYLYKQQQDYLDKKTPVCDLYNQIPGLFQKCIITEVNSFQELITAEDDEKSYFTIRYKGDRKINYIDLDRTFYKCVLKNQLGDSIPFEPELMWDVYQINETQSDVARVLNLRMTFSGTYQTKVLNPLKIQWVYQMYETFFNCTYGADELGNIITPSPADGLTFAYSWGWKENYPLIPPKFFDVGYNCNMTRCFANESRSINNLQGQLPSNKDELWWSKTASVNTSTAANLTQFALIHPIREIVEKTETNDAGEEMLVTYENFYVYPKAYTDAYYTYTGMYKHIIMPLAGSATSTQTLYLFEDDTTKLNLKTSLPCLPGAAAGSTAYVEFLKRKAWKVKINKSDKFNTYSMGNADYKSLIPASLFLVLNKLQFDSYNMANSRYILYHEGTSDGYNHISKIFNKTQATPGGIIFSQLNTTLQSVLVEPG